MAATLETGQKMGLGLGEDGVFNPDTKIRTVRTDVDEKFSIPKLGVSAFAVRQITTCPPEVIGEEKQRASFLEVVRSQDPNDSALFLIGREPLLMLSNLTGRQLVDLVEEVWKAKNIANQHLVTDAISVIKGILIGRATSGKPAQEVK